MYRVHCVHCKTVHFATLYIYNVKLYIFCFFNVYGFIISYATEQIYSLHHVNHLMEYLTWYKTLLIKKKSFQNTFHTHTYTYCVKVLLAINDAFCFDPNIGIFISMLRRIYNLLCILWTRCQIYFNQYDIPCFWGAVLTINILPIALYNVKLLNGQGVHPSVAWAMKILT